MIQNDFQYPIDFLPGKAGTPFQPDRVQPDNGLAIVALHLNVRGFVPVSQVEEGPIRPMREDGWHFLDVILLAPESDSRPLSLVEIRNVPVDKLGLSAPSGRCPDSIGGDHALRYKPPASSSSKFLFIT